MPPELLSTPWGGAYWIVAVASALAVHEFAHAATAYLLGDATPKNEGRVTLFPFPHIDPLGFLLFLFFGVGWAKPVKFAPESLRFHAFGRTLVSLAGPFANLTFLAATIAVARLAASVGWLGPDAALLGTALVTVNAILIAVNVIPVPPFDGSKLLLDALSALRAERASDLVARYGPAACLALLFLDGTVGPHLVPHLLAAVVALAKSYIIA